MPTPLTHQIGNTNNMKITKSEAPMVDVDGILRNLTFSYRYSVKTAAYTVKYYETGTVFLTYGGTAAVTFTLPAISTGPWNYTFINGQDQDMTVTAGTADTLIGYNDLDLDSIAFSTSSEKIGGGVDVFCDGTKLLATLRLGDGRYQTATLAD